MSNTLALLLSVFVVILVLIINSLFSYLVKRFITEQGGKILECRLAEFRPGKYPSRGDPVYQVRFLDKSGNEHKSYLRMSFIAGVSIEEDQIIKSIEIEQKQNFR